jgi:hypothetical protein
MIWQDLTSRKGHGSDILPASHLEIKLSSTATHLPQSVLPPNSPRDCRPMAQGGTSVSGNGLPWSMPALMRHIGNREKPSHSEDDAPPVRLSATERHVALVLVSYLDKFGQAYPSQLRIADETGYSRQAVNKALRTLESCGLIRVVGRMRRDVAKYAFEDPPPDDSTCQPGRRVNVSTCQGGRHHLSRTLTPPVKEGDTKELTKEFLKDKRDDSLSDRIRSRQAEDEMKALRAKRRKRNVGSNGASETSNGGTDDHAGIPRS